MTDKPVWPARRLVLTFTHPAAGDKRFGLMAEEAFSEWRLKLSMYDEPMRGEVECKPYTARNGVTITSSGYEVEYGPAD